MIGRLPAVLALLTSGFALALGAASPAAACSCERLDARDYVQRADFAFVGTTTEEREEDAAAVYRFSVDTVYLGEVRRTQDVATPRAPGEEVSSCEEQLPVGTSRLVLGSVDDRGRLTFGLCQQPAWGLGEPFTDRLLSALGAGSEPLPGEDLVELQQPAVGESPWWKPAAAVGAVVAAVAAVAVGVVVLRLRRRRAA